MEDVAKEEPENVTAVHLEMRATSSTSDIKQGIEVPVVETKPEAAPLETVVELPEEQSTPVVLQQASLPVSTVPVPSAPLV